MKRYLIALIAVMTLGGSALALESESCHVVNGFTICEFSPSGRVNVSTSLDDGTYFSDWYTAAEWHAKKLADARKAKLGAARHYSEAERREFCSNFPTDSFTNKDGSKTPCR